MNGRRKELREKRKQEEEGFGDFGDFSAGTGTGSSPSPSPSTGAGAGVGVRGTMIMTWWLSVNQSSSFRNCNKHISGRSGNVNRSNRYNDLNES